MSGYEQIIAILVDRLGGEVTIGHNELLGNELGLQMEKHPTAFAYRLRTVRDGEASENGLPGARLEIEA